MSCFGDDEKRTNIVKQNAFLCIILKGAGIGISFLSLPLIVRYLTEIEYGVWATFFSVMSWVNLLDIGVSLGVRNKLAEAISKNDLNDIKYCISTGFVAVISIGVIFFFILVYGIQVVDFQSFFNTKEISPNDLFYIALYMGIFIIFSFVLSIVDQIFYAYQKVAMNGVIQVMQNMIMICIIYVLSLQNEYKLIYFVIGFGAAVISPKILFIIIFFFKHRELIPDIKYVQYEKMKSIFSLGCKFFVMQIACILAFSSSNLIILKMLGPEYIRTYDIVLKVFSVLITIHALLGSALWSAYTDAYVMGDLRWISNSLKKMNLLLIIFFIVSTMIAILIEKIVNVWLGLDLEIPLILRGVSVVYIVVYCWNSNYAYLVNGIGKVNVQMIGWISGMILILPLSFIFTKYMHMKSEGVMLSIICCLLVNSIILPIYVHKYLKI